MTLTQSEIDRFAEEQVGWDRIDELEAEVEQLKAELQIWKKKRSGTITTKWDRNEHTKKHGYYVEGRSPRVWYPTHDELVQAEAKMFLEERNQSDGEEQRG